MRAKTVLLALCLTALAGAAGFLYFANSKQQAELLRLRQEHDQAQKSLAEAEEAKAAGANSANEELAQLRKDREDLLRLRNEVRQLRTEKQQLEKQVQTAQTETQRAQTQAQAAQAQAAQAQAQSAQAQAQAATLRQTQTPQTAEQEAFRKRYGLGEASPDQAASNACVSNLRQIDGAKQQWALENRKAPTAVPTAQDIARYLRGNINCPAGGIYTFYAVSAAPACSVHGTLPR